MPRNPALTADLESNLRDREPRIFLRRGRWTKNPRGTEPNNRRGRQAKRNGQYSRSQRRRYFQDGGQAQLVRAIARQITDANRV